MSAETLEWLNQNTLIGYTATRGKAWHFTPDEQGDEPNHYPEAIPVADVNRRLFHWDIERAPLQAMTSVGFVTVEGKMATVRSDTGAVLGIVSDRYTEHQYREWLIKHVGALLDVSGSDLGIGSAILLKGGAVAAVQIERPDSVMIGGDEQRPFLLASTSADGSLATSYRSCYQRVVCDNTHEAALREKDSAVFSVRHTRNSADRLGEARQALEIAYTQLDRFAADVEQLMNTTVNPMEFQAVRNVLLPLPAEKGGGHTRMENIRHDIEALYTGDPRVAPYQGTAWGVLQAFNTYRQHESTIRKATNREEKNRLALITGETGTADRKVLAAVSQAKRQPVLV
jgi:phage/plasmid-like protein (TIGR03299 family)